MIPIGRILFSNTRRHATMNLTALLTQLARNDIREKDTHLLMLMVIAPLMCLEFIDPAVSFLAELTVERLAGFAGGLCLYLLSERWKCPGQIACWQSYR